MYFFPLKIRIILFMDGVIEWDSSLKQKNNLLGNHGEDFGCPIDNMVSLLPALMVMHYIGYGFPYQLNRSLNNTNVPKYTGAE